MKSKFPKQLIVFICDHTDAGKPIYAAVEDLQEIPEDTDGNQIAFYDREKVARFRVKRTAE